jgi:hypothetical protein
MNRLTLMGAVGLAATSLVVVTATGCSSNSSSKPSSSSSASGTSTSSAAASTSAAAAPSDYTTLLIQPSDIQAPGDTFSAQGAATPIPGAQPGVTQAFTNQRGDRIIGDTILILPDAAAAGTALEGAKSALGSSVTGTPAPVNVGTGGTMVAGNSPDGSKAVTVVLFTEGKAFTTLEFDSGPSDAVPAEFATDVATKQDAAIKKGLPG